MARIVDTRPVITGYHCSYSPCSSYKMLEFLAAQITLKCSFIFCAENLGKIEIKVRRRILPRWKCLGKEFPVHTLNCRQRAHLSSHMILWQRDDVWICGKLKAQYILFGKAYGYKTW